MNTKYNYYKVIQQNYGQGWEDVSFYETKSDYISREKSGKTIINKYGKEYQERLISHDLSNYRYMGYSTRVIKRKELKNNN